MTDNEVINILWPNKICLLDRCKSRLTDEIKEYLQKKFKYSESLYESLFCIKYHIDRDNMICPICGKGILKFNGDKSRGYFNQGCCKECTYKIRQKHSIETSLKKYGEKYPRQNKETNKKINTKRKQTCLEKYGNENYTNFEKTKQTCLKKYGVKYSFQSNEVKEKIRQTCLEKYGNDWTFQNELSHKHYKETMLKKYGVENSFCIPNVLESFKIRKNEIQQKRDNTKRKNKTFGTSIPEEKSYRLLLTIFDKDDILRQYKEERYPFNCDFYIISLDLFIECNYFWTHQNHFFNCNDKNDNEILKTLIEKSKKYKFYNTAITTWTISDVNKKNIAEQNNLNYKVFWNYIDFENWIKYYEAKSN